MPVGAPKGNQNAVKAKRVKTAIDKALENKSKALGQQALVAISETVVDAALNGEQWAVRELYDRIDGKPHQSVYYGDVEERDAKELSDAELANIAATGRSGVDSEAESAEIPDSVH